MLAKFHSGLLALSVLAAGAVSADTPVFEPRPIAEHIYAGGWEHFVGGGVAAFDCNDDLLPELFAAGGTNPAQLFINATDGHGGALTFSEQTPASLALTGVIGAYPLDIDGDKILDLAVLRVGPDLLLQGAGNCEFAPFESLSLPESDHWTTAFSATWELDQTLPTLAFGTYVDRTNPDGPFEACDDTLLFRPLGNQYTDLTRLTPGHCALSMLFTDWARTGRADLRVSNDRHYYVRGGQEQMWAMEGTPRLYTEEDGWRPYSLWGMGIASRDLTGDGFSDVYLTSMGDQKLQVRDMTARGPSYRDVTYEFGTTAHRPYAGGDGRPSTGWHAAFGDANNDGRDDIFVAKGNVEQMPDAAMKDPNNLLLQSTDGSFVESGSNAGIASLHRSRGAVFQDLNLDGFLDLAVMNRRALLELFENTGSTGNWLLIDVQGAAPNTRAVGGFIELRAGNRLHTREITVGGGHAGGSAVMHHFGLGTADTAELRILWPDGRVGDWQNVSVNQILTVK
ncbi:MAG: CRTAC1 family protein [Paracoccaceae bacterium]